MAMHGGMVPLNEMAPIIIAEGRRHLVALAVVFAVIALIALVIGLCTFGMVTLGIMLGHALGAMVGKRAEMLGGVILIGVGAVILYEHLSA
jgi:putative Mn2+ efflux pump MntP